MCRRGGMMQVTLNGEPREVEAGTTMAVLLDALNVEPVRVAVEINRELVPRRDFENTSIGDGDVIEVVTFVGGG